MNVRSFDSSPAVSPAVSPAAAQRRAKAHARRCTFALLLLAGLLQACSPPDTQTRLAAAQARLAAGDSAAALVEARALLQQQAQWPQGRLLLAEALLAEGDADGAETELQRAAERDAPALHVLALMAETRLLQGKPAAVLALGAEPSVGAAGAAGGAELAARFLTARALAHRQLGQTAEADAALASALALHSRHAPAQLAQARALAAQGRWADARERTAQVLAHAPTQADALALDGELIVASGGDSNAAQQRFEQALASRARHLHAHAGLVRLALRAQDLGAAQARSQAMLRALPHQALSLHLAAQVALVAQDHRRALELAQQVLRAAPRDLDTLLVAAAANQRLGDRAQAESQLGLALSIDPASGPVRRQLAALQLERGRADAALGVLTPLLAQAEAAGGAGSADAALWSLAGQVHAAQRDFSRAQQAFQRAQKLAPDDAAVLSHRGRAWLAEGRREQGLQALETAAAAAGGGPQSEADLALLSEHVAQGDGAAALRVLDRLAQRHAGRPQPLQWRAELLARQGEPVAARQAFEAALARDSAWLPALEGLTRLDLAAGQPDSARQRWEAVLKKQPRSSAAMLALARLAKLAPPKPGGNAPDAQTWLDRAVAVDPTHADTWLAAIAQHHTFGDTAGALARAQAAALALPDHAPVLAALGQAQLLSGEGQQAARSFARLVELSPRELEPRLWLAEAHLRLSQWPAARKAVQGAAELAPSAPAVLRARIVTELESGQAEAARAIARQQQKAAPKAALGWQLEADIDSRLQRWDAAAQGYRQALAWERSGALAVQLHQTLVKAQRGDEASRWADEWLRHNPRDSAMLLQLARSAGTHSPQAVAAWRRALAVQPDDPLRLNNLAHHLLNTAGKTEGNSDGESRAEALALARRAVQAAPFNAELLDTLAAALAANGQPAAAATALRRALDIAPRHDAARLHLARVLIASGDKDQAGIELQKLQDRGADFKRQAEVTALLGTLR